jgi:hypothetical protein
MARCFSTSCRSSHATLWRWDEGGEAEVADPPGSFRFHATTKEEQFLRPFVVTSWGHVRDPFRFECKSGQVGEGKDETAGRAHSLGKRDPA